MQYGLYPLSRKVCSVSQQFHRPLVVFLLLAIATLNPRAQGETAVNATKSTDSVDRVVATLNGTTFEFDRRTGSLIALSHPGPGTLLQAEPAKASLVDVAYPIEKYGPLRLASRFSRSAEIDVAADRIVIHWARLGPSRSLFDPSGDVETTVTLSAADDGISILMHCEIANHTDRPIPQVLFPDFMGMLPFAGADQTEFRTAAFVRKPFLELPPDEGRSSQQFCMDSAMGHIEFKSGGMFSDMWLRWMDFGGLNGGMSLYQKAWGWEPRVNVRLHHDPHEQKIRLLCVHTTAIEPGARWQSGDFVLTPHKLGWAKGIEPYRKWARGKLHKEFSMPRHVREGLGFRTIWMGQSFPDDPQDAVWKFSDYPAIARETKEHGIDEIVVWAWVRGFELPLPPPFHNLGTEEDFVRGVAEAKKLGVNVAPFISVLQASHATGAKYGLSIPTTGGWAQHTDAIPAFQAPYIALYQCAAVPTNNPLWQREVLDSCKHLIDIGIPSLSWDQFWTDPAQDIIRLTSEIRAHARKVDPESTFSAEALWNMEIDADYLDYTWNWGGFRDCQAFTNAFPSPRISCIVTAAPSEVKRAFLDSLYMNLMPRKPESVNGSDTIVNHPELSAALKQCADLRRRFLPYFTEGTLIGNCILAAPCPGFHVSAYTLPDRVLVLALNMGGKGPLEFTANPAGWLPSPKGTYAIQAFDSAGRPTRTQKTTGTEWRGAVESMEPLEIAVFEIRAAE